MQPYRPVDPTPKKPDPVARAVAWALFALALVILGFGAWVYFASGGQDAGGMFGLAFIVLGVLLGIPSLRYALTGELRGGYFSWP